MPSLCCPSASARSFGSALRDLPVPCRAAQRLIVESVDVGATGCEDQTRLRSDAVGGPMKPEEVVGAEMQAWSTLDADQIMARFTQDATWMPSLEHPTAHGYEEIRRAVEDFLPSMTWGELEIVNIAVAGNVVLTERVDRFIMNGEKLEAPGMGIFEVAGDKITAWRDYFCPFAHH